MCGLMKENNSYLNNKGCLSGRWFHCRKAHLHTNTHTHTHTHCTLGNDAETSKLQWHFNSVCKHKHTGVFILYWLVQSCVTALTVSSVQTVLYMLSQNTYQQDNAKTILLFPPSAQSGDLKWTRPKWPNVLSRTRQWAHEHSLHL